MHPLEGKDFLSVLMATTGGGIWDDLGWLYMADIQQFAADASERLRKVGLCSNEPVLIPVGGRAEDVAAIIAVIEAGGIAVPFHRKSHPIRVQTLSPRQKRDLSYHRSTLKRAVLPRQ